MELAQTKQIPLTPDQFTALAPSQLDPTHYLAAHKLAQGRKKSKICLDLHITPPTLNSWLENPDFQLLLEQLKVEYIERVVLPLEDVQRRINLETYEALNCIIDIRDDDFGDHQRANTRLKAAEMLLKRASNSPKEAKDADAPVKSDIFSPTFIQVLVETANQIGDSSIFKAANAALGSIPQKSLSDIPENNIIDLKPLPTSNQIFSLEDILTSSLDEEEEECS